MRNCDLFRYHFVMKVLVQGISHLSRSAHDSWIEDNLHIFDSGTFPPPLLLPPLLLVCLTSSPHIGVLFDDGGADWQLNTTLTMSSSPTSVLGKDNEHEVPCESEGE